MKRAVLLIAIMFLTGCHGLQFRIPPMFPIRTIPPSSPKAEPATPVEPPVEKTEVKPEAQADGYISFDLGVNFEPDEDVVSVNFLRYGRFWPVDATLSEEDCPAEVVTNHHRGAWLLLVPVDGEPSGLYCLTRDGRLHITRTEAERRLGGTDGLRAGSQFNGWKWVLASQ